MRDEQAISPGADLDRRDRVIVRLTTEVGALGQLVIAARTDLEAMAGRLQALEAEAAALRADRDALLASTSWRITAPLRRCVLALRAIRNSGRGRGAH